MKFQLALVKTQRKAASKPVKARPPVRVRHLPPTVEEALFAAQGLTEDRNQQVEIAATLMDLTVDQAWQAVRKAAAERATGVRLVVATPKGATRTVVVQHARTIRRPGAPAPLRPFGRTL